MDLDPDPGGTKNIWIQIRIRIRNTDFNKGKVHCWVKQSVQVQVKLLKDFLEGGWATIELWVSGADPDRIGLLGKPPAVEHSFIR
jgi:hypothetical protein